MYEFSDAPLPKVYALPKLHKINVPFRIIVFSIGTALYELAKFLERIISDSILKARGYVNNSFELYNRLSGVEVRKFNVLASLDVTSLFTNVLLELVIKG